MSGCRRDTMRIVPVRDIRIGQEVGGAPFVERRPFAAGVGRFEDAAAREADIHMRGIARIDKDRVRKRTIGRAVADRPLREHRVIVEAGDGRPVIASVLRAKQPARRRARIPHAVLRGMPGRKPEHPLDGARRLALGCLTKGRRLGRFLPRLAAIVGAEHGRAQMPGLRSDEHRLRISRILHDVMDHMAEELRPVQFPGPAAGIRAQHESAFASADPDRVCAHGKPSYFLCEHPMTDEVIRNRQEGYRLQATGDSQKEF